MKRYTKIVEEILIEDSKARNSDKYLYFKVLKRVMPDSLDLSVRDFLLYADSPSFETIRRVRQKVQEKNPSLKACKEVQVMRNKLETQYRVFARF